MIYLRPWSMLREPVHTRDMAHFLKRSPPVRVPPYLSAERWHHSHFRTGQGWTRTFQCGPKHTKIRDRSRHFPPHGIGGRFACQQQFSTEDMKLHHRLLGDQGAQEQSLDISKAYISAAKYLAFVCFFYHNSWRPVPGRSFSSSMEKQRQRSRSLRRRQVAGTEKGWADVEAPALVASFITRRI